MNQPPSQNQPPTPETPTPKPSQTAFDSKEITPSVPFAKPPIPRPEQPPRQITTPDQLPAPPDKRLISSRPSQINTPQSTPAAIEAQGPVPVTLSKDIETQASQDIQQSNGMLQLSGDFASKGEKVSAADCFKLTEEVARAKTAEFNNT